MKKIAIVSQNKNFARFVELELLSLRLECDVFLKIPVQISEYSVMVIDTDTVDVSDGISKKTLITIGNNSSYKQDSFASLPYPFSFYDFKNVLDMCVENDKKIDKIFEHQNIKKEDENLLYINNKSKTVFAFGERISVSEYEIKLLERLCETPGNPVSRRELSCALGSQGDTNIADVYVCHLRRKFGRLSDKKVIYTIRLKGYMSPFTIIKE